ncbi:hypothetical protein M0805_006734 [Coniferiporia weirii]|nr:hypothetical protein M0805_006734 [Coniferiporia weirii]
MSVERGTYIISNIRTGTVLEVADYDNKSVIGQNRHGRENQQWTLEYLGGGYSIRNVRSGGYLSFENLVNGTPLIVTNYPTPWTMQHELGQAADIFRIQWPNGIGLVDLWGGSSAPRRWDNHKLRDDDDDNHDYNGGHYSFRWVRVGDVRWFRMGISCGTESVWVRNFG